MFDSIQLIELLDNLISFRSVTPDDATSLSYIFERLKKIGAECHWVNYRDTRNAIITIGHGSKTFAFAGHVDVVPSGDEFRWAGGNPFKLNIDGEKLIGRGAADMKGSIAAFIIAVEQFVANRNHQWADFKIMLLLTSDEEGSAIDGTPRMVEYLQKKQQILDYCLVGEPSCVSHIGDCIKVGRRGSLTGELKVFGKQGHIAYPHLCQNPIHDFAAALAELTAINWDEGNEYFPPTSFQFANINSGIGATNVIPGELGANFNFRYNNLQTVEKLQKNVSAILDKHQLKYQLDWNHSAAPFMTKMGELVRIVSDSVNEICGISPQLKTDGGTSDGRFLVAVSREIVECGLRNDSIHQINEYTTIHDLMQLSRIYLSILDNLFAKSQ